MALYCHRKLLSQLEQFQGSRGKGAKVPKGEDGNNVINFQLTQRPGHAQLAHTARLAELEQRLARIEQTVGATPAKMVRITC